jgi:hypothetical protein
MSDQKKTSQEPAKGSNPANQAHEQRGQTKATEGQGKIPGTPRNDEHGKTTGHSTPDHREHDKDADRRQPRADQDMPSKEQPRDRDKDREDPMKGHQVGDEDPAHTTKAKA